MRDAHPSRHAPEARAMQLPVARQMLTQMDHLVSQTGQKRGGVSEPS